MCVPTHHITHYGFYLMFIFVLTFHFLAFLHSLLFKFYSFFHCVTEFCLFLQCCFTSTSLLSDSHASSFFGMTITAGLHNLMDLTGLCILHLYYKDLWLSNKVPAVVSFERGHHVLDTNFSIVAINMVILSVTQEGEQKAISI